MYKPIKPAALSCRTHGLARCMDVLAGLFGQSNPDYMCAAGFSASPHFLYSGYDSRGEWFQLFHIAFGGIAAAPSGDGADGHGMWPDFTNVPCEYLEAICPLRMDAHEVIPDSGGPGLHRGGNGVHTAYRILNAGDVSIHDDRWLSYPWGVRGGLPGANEAASTSSARMEQSRFCPRSAIGCGLSQGDVVHYCTWGGGGWGDPLERPVGAGRVRRGSRPRHDLRAHGATAWSLDEDFRRRRGRHTVRYARACGWSGAIPTSSTWAAISTISWPAARRRRACLRRARPSSRRGRWRRGSGLAKRREVGAGLPREPHGCLGRGRAEVFTPLPRPPEIWRRSGGRPR